MIDITQGVANRSLISWVEEIAALTQPDDVHWCDGSRRNTTALCDEMVDAGTFIRLNAEKRPEQFLCALRSRATSRASRTARSSARAARTTPARPTTGSTRARCRRRSTRAVRRLHARPHDVRRPVQHGPARLADRAHRRRAHRLAVRRREHADHDPDGPRGARGARHDGEFVRCLHSVGTPLEPGQADVAWPCNAEHKYIVHFPEERAIWSFGSRLRRQRAARQEVLRAAHRLGAWRATRAGSPSTC